MATYDSQRIRQGLPRTPGGEPWPAGGVVAEVSVAEALLPVPEPPVERSAQREAETKAPDVEASGFGSSAVRVASEAAPASAAGTTTVEVALRQGLPRTPGGDPWPPAGVVAVPVAEKAPPVERNAQHEAETKAPDVVASGFGSPSVRSTSEAAPEPTPTPEPVLTPEATPTLQPKPTREPRLIRGRALGQWAKLTLLWGGGAILAAGIIVLAARGVTTLPGVPEFLERYPGEYHSPVPTEDGFPVWARWAHFLNFFLMVLIIRSGLLVRHQQRPDAFYAPKKGGKKISIYLWLHTSLDVLWLLNGIAFVVLLFASGHWARIVPTSWEVFPNALSAGLQYLTLQWPVENGWVNYNSLQQLMYFTVVFVAAPLAAITGVRMSEWWPEHAERLNKLYPAPLARAIHYPTMLFFVLFILVHVFLVLTTEALKNLNHMFAGTPEVSWVGFWWFAAGLLVTAVVTWAARPLVLAPIANLFGRVSER